MAVHNQVYISVRLWGQLRVWDLSTTLVVWQQPTHTHEQWKKALRENTCAESIAAKCAMVRKFT